MRLSVAVTGLILVVTGCASTAPPTAAPPAPVQPLRQSVQSAESDAAALRATLEEAYERIQARSTGANAPLVDADAILSMEVPDHRSIRGALSYFSTDLHDKIQQSLLRSSEYKAMIDATLDEYQLPRGLAWLPVIESAYVPTLTSRSGAHGIWQFMPDTAREYGLRVDWWVDERADPEKSTRAAAAYLQDLYGAFGDWSLTLAAYNAGPGRIKRALERSGSSTFWDLSEKAAIPKETRGYVPTFFATLLIVSDPSTYGFQLAAPAKPESRTLEIEGPVSLAFLADTAGIDASQLERLNPSLFRRILPPGRFALRVPAGVARTLAGRAATLRLEDPNLAIATFTLRRGDSLDSLARALHLDTSDIAAMNSPRRQLRSGDTIWIPLTQRELSTRLLAAAETRYHVVRAGETLYSIARRYGLTVEELTDLNRISSRRIIHPGDRLRVSTGSAIASGGM